MAVFFCDNLGAKAEDLIHWERSKINFKKGVFNY